MYRVWRIPLATSSEEGTMMNTDALLAASHGGDELRYVTEHFRDLQGLRLAPVWVLLMGNRGPARNNPTVALACPGDRDPAPCAFRCCLASLEQCLVQPPLWHG